MKVHPSLLSHICYYLFALVVSILVTTVVCSAQTKAPNVLVNGGFETGLSGWNVEGAVALETGHPLEGKSSVRIGPGKGVIRQSYAVGGLRILELYVTMKADSARCAGILRAQCFDSSGHLLMDLQQSMYRTSKTDSPWPQWMNLYFKTHAHTATVVVSMEKSSEQEGNLLVDSVQLIDDDRDRSYHHPLCDLNRAMAPIWDSKQVYNETVLMRSEGGGPATGKLLFPAKRILSVRDYGLSTTYLPGRDYTVLGNTLVCTPKSRMPYIKASDIPATKYPWLKLHGKHVVVTYTHEEGLDEDEREALPTYQGNRLPKTMHRLLNRSHLNIVALGDSITLGIGTSAYMEIPPYMPTWGDLFVDRLQKIYGYYDIHLVNAALGGMTSDWGLQNAESAVAGLDPDLVIIAFGMNDFWSNSPDIFAKNIRGIMERIRAHHPNTEFVLISSSRYDPAYTEEALYRDQLPRYADAQREMAGEGVAFLDMTGLCEMLFDRKRPKDLLVDPLHPNDFLARLYAQGMVTLLDHPHGKRKSDHSADGRNDRPSSR